MEKGRNLEISWRSRSSLYMQARDKFYVNASAKESGSGARMRRKRLKAVGHGKANRGGGVMARPSKRPHVASVYAENNEVMERAKSCDVLACQ